jgi:menaquinone-dependent protoporphyrinogen IX oxidase
VTGKILIAYTSRKGSTAEIARAIGTELEAAGNRVEVADMKGITSVGGYRAALEPVKPASVTMFAGVLELSRMSFVERTMTTLMNVLTGDFRDREAIRAWAQSLPAVLKI